MPGAYYNENDKFCADRLEELIRGGFIPDGDVDRRSIALVCAEDIRRYDQCHFFAGIGGWPLALRMCGWPDEEKVWTGSCPCQPWSDARVWHSDTAGFKDDRDLWPDWNDLVGECNPASVYGEQVNSTLALQWLDRTAANLESKGYAFAAADIPACSVGCPQRRGRLWFAAHLSSPRAVRLVESAHTSEAGPWRWRGEADMREIFDAPRQSTNRWPKPIICAVDDGLRMGRVGLINAYGNAIVPQVAKQFILSTIN